MPSKVTALPVKRTFGQTMRDDAWWVQPVIVFIGFSAFIVYSTWAAFQGVNYMSGNLLSPFYSPEIWGSSHHAMIQADGPPGWWPGFMPYSPAFLILWAPVSFRLTCYYYRGAYYKAFWADPINCSVGEPRNSYLGERHLPLPHRMVERKGVQQEQRHPRSGRGDANPGVSHGDVVGCHHGAGACPAACVWKRSRFRRSVWPCGSCLRASHWVRTARVTSPAAA